MNGDLKMADASTKSGKRLLDPMERISEVLFGLIMVLTVTCSFSVAEAGRQDVRSMLLSAFGCAVAWGIIDAIFYLMDSFARRRHGILMLRAMHKAASPGDAHEIIAGVLPPALASVLTPLEFEGMRQRLNELPEPQDQSWLTKDDWLAAAGLFLLVVLPALPLVIPFICISEPRPALRVSNAVAIVMLFLAGYSVGRYAGLRPWRTGFTMVIAGAALVGITIALGG